MKKIINFTRTSAKLGIIIGILIIPAFSRPALAQDYQSLIYEPQVQIPISGSGFDKTSQPVGQYNESTGKMTSDLLARYIKVLYDYGMSIAGILAAIVLMGGGFLWLASGGNDSKIAQAKEMIVGSVVGLAILFSSWIILNTVNPELIKMKPISTQVFFRSDYFCCQYKDPTSLESDKIRAEMLAEDECKKKDGGTIFTPQKNIFGKTTNYSVNSKGTRCVLPGCCISRVNGTSTGAILKCSNSFYHNCSFGFFMETECEFVGEEMDANGTISSCKNNKYGTDLCANAENGDDCFDDQHYADGSSCYDGVCWHGDGKEGEPCGNELYSKCDADKPDPKNGLTCVGDWGGRDCISGFTCCKFMSNGQRIND